MKSLLFDFLICPACLPIEVELIHKVFEKNGEDVLTGLLECKKCGARYPIEEGIACLDPRKDLNGQGVSNPYESVNMVSSYLWSHYADLIEDDDAHDAYGTWASLLQHVPGPALDAGCAVGRFTFEMSQYSDFSVGIDLSRSFIQQARKLMTDHHLVISIPEEGSVFRQETIRLPEEWNTDKIEFIVGDIQALPFHSGAFSLLSSLNLVDKVALPLVHLNEMNRVAKKRQAQFLFSDPFSWSTEIAKQEDWLGGTDQGPYSGRGLDNVASLLAGERGGLTPAWKIDKEGNVWWKIRNHANHFELIRSCYIKADR